MSPDRLQHLRGVFGSPCGGTFGGSLGYPGPKDRKDRKDQKHRKRTPAMHIRKTAACALVALSLAACQTGSTGETVGTIGGAAGGALLGSQLGQGKGQIAATAVGTLVGALAGRELGRRLQGSDQQRAVAAERSAIERNETITWTNPNSGYRGTVQPGDSYVNSAGQTCRNYTHTVYIEGRAETAQGTACRQGDGTWRLVS